MGLIILRSLWIADMLNLVQDIVQGRELAIERW